MKPIQAGKGDRVVQSVVSLQQSMEKYTVVLRHHWPSLAAAREGRRVELELVWQAFESLRSSRDWVLVEHWEGSLR